MATIFGHLSGTERNINSIFEKDIYEKKKKQNFAILVRLRWDLCRTHNIDAEEGETIRWTQRWMTMPADFAQNGTFIKLFSR